MKKHFAITMMLVVVVASWLIGCATTMTPNGAVIQPTPVVVSYPATVQTVPYPVAVQPCYPSRYQHYYPHQRYSRPVIVSPAPTTIVVDIDAGRANHHNNHPYYASSRGQVVGGYYQPTWNQQPYRQSVQQPVRQYQSQPVRQEIVRQQPVRISGQVPERQVLAPTRYR